MTPGEIIYQRRLAVLAHAQKTRNVAQTCRTFGVSRTRYYEWKRRADAYGLDALLPKEPAPPAAHRDPHPRGRAPLDPGGARAHHRVPPIRRPAL